MPYFKNENVNILFIHIPKTGGTSIDRYFSKKFDILLNNSSLYNNSLVLYQKIDNGNGINTSLQHMKYNTIMQHRDTFNINIENLEIITAVRNPYHRIVSDLFFTNKITRDSSKEDVYIAMQEYIVTLWDNHGIPQYFFLLDENNNLIQNVKIMRMESLQFDMIELGYTDFDVKTNCNGNNVNYNDYLNTDSINLINNYYEKDFEFFGYTKIEII